MNLHAACDRKITDLNKECAGLRTEVRRLKTELEVAKACAWTANSIAVQVFAAVKAATRQRNNLGERQVELSVT